MRQVGTVLITVLCGACTMPAVATQPSPTTTAPEASEATSALARDVLAEVNRTRAAHGIPRLAADEALNRAARGHAEELAARRRLDHSSTDPERRTMTMRIEAAGGTWTRAAENLASMSGPAGRVPAEAARMWLNSDGHRRNMLGAAFTHTGVGVAVDRYGVWYVTQLYVLPRSGR